MVEREKLAVLKANKISKTGEAMPTKIGLHAFQITLYLHEFFELNLFLVEREKLAVLKANKISETGETTPTKSICMHFT